MNFKNKTIIITGSARGIGEAIAKRFALYGGNIVINGMPHEEDAGLRIVDEINNMDSSAHLVLGNVTKPDDVKRIIDEAKEKFGTIDVVVNNAGITKDNLIMRMSHEDFDAVIDVNLKGAFNMIKASSSIMLKQRSGVYINVASVVGVMGNAGQANYAASKAGLIGLTKSTAKEFAARGVRCNAVAPGFIRSDMTDKLSDEVKENYFKSIPLKAFGEPEDVADAITFLASDYAKYITGQVLHIDGGLVM